MITALDVGGAQAMLWKLLSRIDRSRFDPCVIALSDVTDMVPVFRRLGISCETLGMRSNLASLGRLSKLANRLRAFRPDVVQGWMYHGNLAASAACATSRLSVPVLWNIRATLIDRDDDKTLTGFLIWLGGKFSFSAARIVNNSKASAEEHERRFGYRRDITVVLPNGFDTDLFKPSEQAKGALREELKLPAGTILVGMIARYHAMKDHETFLRAAASLSRRYENVHFVLAGERIERGNEELSKRVNKYDLSQRVHLLGRREAVETVTAALDIAVSSSSSGEGFPNVIGEAMSCGVACVVTDIGDSAEVVGDTGVVVPRRNPDALAAGIVRLIDAGEDTRRRLGERARNRVMQRYSLDRVVRQYEDLYEEVHAERVRHGIATSLRSSR